MADDNVVGNYRLQNLMMTGQTSQVWEVVELSSHRHFAMKLLLPEKLVEKSHRGFLLHEAAVGKKLAHPNIIRIVHVDTSKNPHFVMEFFPAGSLKMRLLKKQHEFIRENLRSILKQAATGMAYMHANGWVHRDIKPDNILVNSSGDLRIIDFALAQRIEKPSFFGKLFRKRGLVQGTRSYMSPEQIRAEPLDGRADIYSFGAAVYELLTGKPPFRAATQNELLVKHLVEKPITPVTLNPDVTKEFGEFVLRMLAKKREERPRDFHEVLVALKNMKLLHSEKEVKADAP